MKKFIAALLAGLTLFTLVGCSGGSKVDSSTPKNYSQIIHDARSDEDNYVASEQQSMEHYLEDQYLVAKAATVTVAPTGEVILVCCEGSDTVLANIKAALAK